MDFGGRYVDPVEVGRGGMGVVYRALDTTSQTSVAIKLLQQAVDRRRLEREVNALKAIDHPAVVRFIEYGLTEHDQPFLVMNWLEGRDLAARFTEGPLTVEQTLELGRRLCQGLSAVHRAGLIHRDLKPSNVMLVDDELSAATICDFGLARRVEQATPLTRSGAMLGTVGYMAPEQAKGHGGVGPRADLFALGCILLEALAGVPAFAGASPATMLVKVLAEEPTPLRELGPHLPEELVQLIEKLLQKSPSQRPTDADQVGRLLDAIDPGTSGRVALTSPPTASAEQWLECVLVIAPARGLESTLQIGEAPTVVSNPSLDALAARHGGVIQTLSGGAQVIRFEDGRSSVERASQAAACALSIAGMDGSSRLAIAVVRAAQSTDGARLKELVERAAVGDVVLDPASAALLDGRFDILVDGDVPRLLRPASSSSEPGRRVLGQVIPFIGRRRELAFLQGAVDELLDEGTPQVIAVCADAGGGKSRLVAELVRRVKGHELSIARAVTSPIMRNSAGGVAQSFVRALLGDEDPTAAGIAARFERLGVASEHLEFVLEFLRLGHEGEPSQRMRFARSDGLIMAQRVSDALAAWHAAESHHRPILFLLEDLHWADAGSLAILRDLLLLGPQLMLLMTTRPEGLAAAEEYFGRLGLYRHDLAPLSSKAAESLVRAALLEATPELVSAIVDRADGNPFFLEELVRVGAEGRTDFPETVLAVAEDRIAGLEPELRSLLRAASVFGERCWAGAVAAVVGAPKTQVLSELDQLVERGALERRARGRFEAELEYRFHHALLRDAAYNMVPEADRARSHERAARWLELQPGRDAVELFDHFLAGDAPADARKWLAEATRVAADAGDLPALLSFVERSEGLELDQDQQRQLYVATLNTALNASAYGVLEKLGPRTWPLCETGSSDWLLAVAYAIVGGTFAGNMNLAVVASASLGPAEQYSVRDATSAQALAGFTLGRLQAAGLTAAEPWHRRLLAAEAQLPSDDLSALGWIRCATSFFLCVKGRPAFTVALKAYEHFEEAGDRVGATQALFCLIWTATIEGRLSYLERAHRAAVQLAASGRGGPLPWAIISLAIVQLQTSPQEALSLLNTVPSDTIHPNNRAMLQWCEAMIRIELGECERVRELIQQVRSRPATGVLRLSHWAEAALEWRLGNHAQVAEALERYDRCDWRPLEGGVDELRLRVAMHRGTGADEARRLRSRYETFARSLDPEARPEFWQNAPRVARLRELIDETIGPSP